MHHVAPYPAALADVVADAGYWPGWSFELSDNEERHAGSRGLCLIIKVDTRNAYRLDEPYTVRHVIAVPPFSHDHASWARWLFDRIGDVELHERMEAFTVAGERPFRPGHGGGHDPYHALTP
jgi:hypothetical protein